MEIGQASYLNKETREYDEEKAEELIPVLKDVIKACLGAIDS